jgi:hypothetical protein
VKPSTSIRIGPDEVDKTRTPAGSTRLSGPESNAISPWVLDAVGVSWTVLVGIATLLPALTHGGSIGSYDILSHSGLTARHAAVHNPFQTDQIDQMIPWATLSWTQVHAGHLPLWNSYSVLGTPLAFNWQSAAFSVPALVSYLVPLRFVYTCQVIVTLIVAGTGSYLFCRVLRLGVVASAFGGVAFELAGPLFFWVGWPIASVFSWTGWILAGFVLIQRGNHRVRYVVLTGSALACAVYAGQPDALAVLFVGIAVFLITSFASLKVTSRNRVHLGPPLFDTLSTLLLGFLLSAPLLLPGLQLLKTSVRNLNMGANYSFTAADALYGYVLSLVAFPNVIDFQYVGVAAVVLAVGSALFCFKREYVAALISLCLIGALLAFVQPVGDAFKALPGLHAVRWGRANILLALGTATLAGVGLQTLARTARRNVILGFGVLFAAAGAALTVVRLTGGNHRGGFLAFGTASYWWVAGGLLLGIALVAVGLVALRVGPVGSDPGPLTLRAPPARRWSQARRLVACAVVGFESVFLVVAGGYVWTASSQGAVATPAVRHLQRIVGSSVVGLGAPDSSVGIRANANILFGIREYAVYDPLLPASYYTSWEDLTGEPGGYPTLSTFDPAFTSASMARLFGVSYVLEPAGKPGPAQSIYVTNVGNEELFKIPRAGFATVTPLNDERSSKGVLVPNVRHTDPSAWRLVIDAKSAQDLHLRLTNVPGWHATIDGRPLRIRPFKGIMLQAKIPAGDHVVMVFYWPSSFTIGLVLAAFGVVGSVVALAYRPIRRLWHIRTIGRSPPTNTS